MSLATGLLALALIAQVFLTLAVYLVMGRRRYAAAAAGRVTAQTYLLVQDEPADLARLTRNLANQFELPVLFYVLAVTLLALNAATLLAALLAWAFVATRVVHAVVHIGSEKVLLRSRIFFASTGLVAALALNTVFVVIGSLA